MRVDLVVILLGFVFLLPSATADEGVDATRPLVALAVRSGPDVVVGWVAAPQGADFYHVYGVHGEARILLDTITHAMHGRVSGAFDEYEVTAVKEGTESKPTPALMEVEAPCTLNLATNSMPPVVTLSCAKIPRPLPVPGELGRLPASS